MNFRNERAFTDAVVDLFKAYGWRVMHMRGNTDKLILGHPGYPDVTAAMSGRVLFAELKMPKGKMTEEQYAWIAVLGGSDETQVHIWRPEDWNYIVTVASGR